MVCNAEALFTRSQPYSANWTSAATSRQAAYPSHSKPSLRSVRACFSACIGVLLMPYHVFGVWLMAYGLSLGLLPSLTRSFYELLTTLNGLRPEAHVSNRFL